MDVKLLACVAITRMCSDRMVVKPMIACVITLSALLATPPTCFTSYKGIHVLVKVAGEVGADQSAL